MSTLEERARELADAIGIDFAAFSGTTGSLRDFTPQILAFAREERRLERERCAAEVDTEVSSLRRQAARGPFEVFETDAGGIRSAEANALEEMAAAIRALGDEE